MQQQSHSGEHFPLCAISAVDGRYSDKTAALRSLFSEYGLIKQRLRIEIEWLKRLGECEAIGEMPPLPVEVVETLDSLIEEFSVADAQQVKQIEAATNHDVKAVEYYLKDKFKRNIYLNKISSFLHFAATSEDINGLAWGSILKEARDTLLLPRLRSLVKRLATLADTYADVALLARTHGQPASPTTFGKEFANFAYRLHGQSQIFAGIRISGKFSGAVGNFNAHRIAYAQVDWPKMARDFVHSLGLEYLPCTAQTDPHDRLAELLDSLGRISSILIDFSRDVWGYIALGHITQKVGAAEIGSSTMPHKVNPIDFENAEGNLGLARALARHMSSKLPISRWQRDLSDSTVLRSLGTVFGYFLIAIESLSRGLDKIEVHRQRVGDELDTHWEVLAEALQTVLRKHGCQDAYERLKQYTREQRLDAESWSRIVRSSPLPEAEKRHLLKLTPAAYTGIAADLARWVGERYSV